VDIWSVGCIFAELIIHEPFFRGDNPQHQLEIIVSKLGCPPRDRLNFIKHMEPLQAILKYEGRRPLPFHAFFPPNTAPVSLVFSLLLVAYCRGSCRMCSCVPSPSLIEQLLYGLVSIMSMCSSILISYHMSHSTNLFCQ
jgi:serine/threonine protein kinase